MIVGSGSGLIVDGVDWGFCCSAREDGLGKQICTWSMVDVVVLFASRTELWLLCAAGLSYMLI